MPLLSAEEWKSKLEYLLKRGVIAAELEKGSTLSEIKQRARLFSRSEELRSIMDQLINSEMIVSEQRARVAEALSEKLRQKYGGKFFGMKNLSVILIGSGIHGGSAVRQLTENYDETDLDWGMITDSRSIFSDQKRENMFDYAEQFVPGLGVRVGIGRDLHSCHTYNPTRVFGQNFSSEQQCFQQLQKIAVGGQFLDENDMVMLAFTPSFPAETNEKNRMHVLSGLRSLYGESPDQWRKVVDDMVDWWKLSHRLKEKHIMVPAQKKYSRSHRLADEVASASEDLMEKGFRALLESTASTAP